MTTVLIEIEKEVQKLLQKTKPRQRGDTLEIVDPKDQTELISSPKFFIKNEPLP